MRDITAVIKTFERPHCCEKLVKSIREFYPHMPIIVVDDSKEPQVFEETMTIPTQFDIGLSEGRNIGLEQVQTQYFLLLDDDFIFTEKTKVEHLAQVLDHTHIDIVGGGINNIFPKTKRSFMARSQAVAWIDDYKNLYLRDGEHYKICGYPVADYVLNFFLGRTEIRDFLTWDKELKIVEHCDYFLRAKRAGVTVAYNGDCVIDHDKDNGSRVYARHRAGRIGRYLRKALEKWDIQSIRHASNPRMGPNPREFE